MQSLQLIPYQSIEHQDYSSEITLEVNKVHFDNIPFQDSKAAFEFLGCKFEKIIIENTEKIDFGKYHFILPTATLKKLSIVATIKGDSVFHPSQSGAYFAKVTSSVATQLTLVSDRINYAAPNEFVDVASASSSENALQQYGKTSVFLAYPNPAKDILHVQTNGKALLSLTDQSGKVLLTQTVEGNGVISVTSLPAGLYYLKNTSTGVTQKLS